ncbi:hypothetical protein MUG94_04725 [Arthrobacter gengyunqii]|uniref:Trm112 family protein n=1 Tax=Arthrobacter gengyunqii TaxID=2886940 RepID=A0A9X1M1J3_9MICC|nr:hypothetical protein [Arthrobacter gengyunqii]MCC3266623.1 hypothetical protein [Arthrobacter gengyunqii]MCC3269613.1 hypothetical protein [Arthrobacter gengyunqii]UOY97076.1 hypothetical protein MUG94_04725 [Arthrobacter gengyunqii]
MVRLTADLMAVLRCPVTGSPLEQGDAGLVSTAPDASGHLVRYVLDEGIPVLLASSAVSGESASDT